MAKALDDQYTSEGLRLASFLDKWSKDEIVSPVDLVKAGLFYCGPADRVKCAFCGGIMYNWVTGDIRFVWMVILQWFFYLVDIYSVVRGVQSN